MSFIFLKDLCHMYLARTLAEGRPDSLHFSSKYGDSWGIPILLQQSRPSGWLCWEKKNMWQDRSLSGCDKMPLLLADTALPQVAAALEPSLHPSTWGWPGCPMGKGRRGNPGPCLANEGRIRSPVRSRALSSGRDQFLATQDLGPMGRLCVSASGLSPHPK